jgi:hypothetical protein
MKDLEAYGRREVLIQEPNDVVRYGATAVPAVRDGPLPVQVPCPTRLAQPWHLWIEQHSRIHVSEPMVAPNGVRVKALEDEIHEDVEKEEKLVAG